MDVINYNSGYFDELLRLWNDSGVKQGFVPASSDYLKELVSEHPYFSGDHAYVLTDGGVVSGFICGCIGDDLPKGTERGYFTCLLLTEEADTDDNASVLFDTLEQSFINAGKKSAAATFFNPMRLPWIMADTEGHRHNNAPGIAIDLPLYNRMLNRGYTEAARECAMYLELSGFSIPDWIRDKESQAASNGYAIEWYDKNRHVGLKDMVDSMGNPQWSAEIPAAAENINMIVAAKGDAVVGFTGPVYPEESGRGYFAGIAVSADHEKRGLGTLLFYKLCEAEKASGAKYMSLFTGVDNRARNIYSDAGFVEKRLFSVMVKSLKS